MRQGRPHLRTTLRVEPLARPRRRNHLADPTGERERRQLADLMDLEQRPERAG